MNYDYPIITSDNIVHEIIHGLLIILIAIIIRIISLVWDNSSKSSQSKINPIIVNIANIASIIIKKIIMCIYFIVSIIVCVVCAIAFIVFRDFIDTKLFVLLIPIAINLITSGLKQFNTDVNPKIYIAIEFSSYFIMFLYLVNDKINYTTTDKILILAVSVQIISLSFKALLTLKQFNTNLNLKIYNAIEYSFYFILFLFLINEKGLL